MVDSSSQSPLLRSEPTSRPAGVHLKKRLRLSHDRGPPQGADFAVAGKSNLYRCLDKGLAHKQELFSFLRQRWQTLFQADFEILLYDLTSTYFACDPPETGKRRFGHSRDHRSDCVQVVIALIVTPEGFPLTYEVMPGNTSDKT